MPNKKERVLLGLSGGLDSTYAVKLLMEQGYHVEGAVLKMHEYTDTEAAELSARELGIPLHKIDCTEAFSRTVIENFIDEYVCARTPNPCIICNREIKFRFLLEYAKENGFDKIATGHYARVVKVGTDENARYAPAMASDGAKDQAYMLYRLTEEQLSHLILPLGEMKKADVREEARRLGLSAAEKKDSLEICFIPDGDYASYVEKYRGRARRGSFINNEGKILGTHEGITHYTVGQRKGLGIALGARAFVTEINPEADTVTLDFEPKSSTVVHISDIVFTGLARPMQTVKIKASVKLRYQARPTEALAEINPDGTAVLYFDEPQKSVTPGQSAVLYNEDFTVLLGGIIDSSF